MIEPTPSDSAPRIESLIPKGSEILYKKLEPLFPTPPDQSPEKRIMTAFETIKNLPDSIKNRLGKAIAITEFALGVVALRIAKELPTKEERRPMQVIGSQLNT